jgi:succinoglycan biosynthesis protein ExoA
MSFIDIIVGVKNEEKYIKRCIRSLQNQTIKDINILVVDGISSDTTPLIVSEIAEKDPRVKLLENPQEVISSGRNIGLDASRAEFVAYLDGHCYVDEDWLKTLYKSFETYHGGFKLAAVGSTYSSPHDDSFFGKTIAYSLQTFFGGFGTAYTASEKIIPVETVAFALYRRSTLLKEHVAYDETMTQCEDTDFNYQLIKAGYCLLKHPLALVHQYRRSNPQEFFRQMVNYGEGRARFTRKYPETLHWYHLLPLIIIFYPILFLIVLFMFLTHFVGLYIFLLISIPILIYIVVDLLYAVFISIKINNWKGVCSIIIFPIVHFGYGIGFLKGLLKR